MSQLINPNTNQAFENSQMQKVFEQMNMMMQYMQQQSQQIRALKSQLMHFGIFQEYVTSHLTGELGDGEPVITIDTEGFPEWAQNRAQEIQAEAQAMLDEARKQTQENREETASKVDLTDE